MNMQTAIVRRPERLLPLATLLDRFDRDQMEAAVDLLLAMMDAQDGDPEAEETGDERDVAVPSGWFNDPACRAQTRWADAHVTDDDLPDGLPGSVDDAEDDDPAAGNITDERHDDDDPLEEDDDAGTDIDRGEGPSWFEDFRQGTSMFAGIRPGMADDLSEDDEPPYVSTDMHRLVAANAE